MHSTTQGSSEAAQGVQRDHNSSAKYGGGEVACSRDRCYSRHEPHIWQLLLVLHLAGCAMGNWKPSYTQHTGAREGRPRGEAHRRGSGGISSFSLPLATSPPLPQAKGREPSANKRRWFLWCHQKRKPNVSGCMEINCWRRQNERDSAWTQANQGIATRQFQTSVRDRLSLAVVYTVPYSARVINTSVCSDRASGPPKCSTSC